MGRGAAEDIISSEGRQMYGLQAFDADSSKGLSAEFAQKVNHVLQ